MATEIKLRPELVPYRRITSEIARTIKIGESFLDLARLGLIGEYVEVPATSICPRLFYRWNGIDGYWEIYAIDNDLIGYNFGAIGDLMDSIGSLDLRVTKLEEGTEEPTEAPTEDPTAEPTEEPSTEEPTEAPTTEPMSLIELYGRQGELIGSTSGRVLTLTGKMKYYPMTVDTPVPGNYAAVVIHTASTYWNQYKNQVELTYKGAKYGKAWFDYSGNFVIYVNFRDPNQMIPIRIDWSSEITEVFMIKADNVILES